MDIKTPPPFRPFTPDEVQRITGTSARFIDQLLQYTLQLVTGDDMQTLGLNYMQTFAVFVADRWLAEGAPEEWARETCKAVAMLGVEEMLAEFRAWRTFPALASRAFNDPRRRGIIMVRDPEGRLGRELNLRRLYEEFLERLGRVFPKEK